MVCSNLKKLVVVGGGGGVNSSQTGVPSGVKEVVKDMIKKLAYATTGKHP